MQAPTLKIIPNISVELGERAKECRNCGHSYPCSHYSLHEDTKDGLNSLCRNCAKELRDQIQNERPRELDFDEPNINYDGWQGGKYASVVKKIKDREDYEVRINECYKIFYVSEYGSDEAAYLAANQWRKEASDRLYLTKNKYKVIKENNVPTYIIVQISQGYVTLLDFSMLDFVRNHTLSASRAGKKLDQCYVIYYDRVTKITKSLSKHVFGSINRIDYLSGCLLDNRSINLRPYVTKKIQRSLGRHPSSPILRQILKIQYDQLMRQYANEYKWDHLSTDENVAKSKTLIALGMKITQCILSRSDKISIYNKYQQNINNNFNDITEAMLALDDRIHPITDNARVYKYCTYCSMWKETHNFYEDLETWDKFSRYCKSCKQHLKDLVD